MDASAIKSLMAGTSYNDAGTTGEAHATKMKLGPYLTPYAKIKLKGS